MATRNDVELGRGRDEIAERIRLDIMTGVLCFGEKISEAHYAEIFNVSRTPVREATLLLVSLGLLTIRPRSGTYVVSFSHRSLSELFDVRLVLESAGVSLASRSQRQALASQLRRMMPELQARISGDAAFDRFSDVDTSFHAALVGAAHNKQLSEIYKPIEVCVQAARSRLAKSAQIAQTANSHHSAMIEAIEDDNFAAFEHQLGDHLAWVVGMLHRVDELFSADAR